MPRVTVHEAQTGLLRLLDRVRAGEAITITEHGKPIARLCPPNLSRPRQPGLLTGNIGDAAVDPLPEDELAAWE